MFKIKKSYSLPIKGIESKFPVQNLYFVGRNYTEHSVEMGEDEKVPPFFFSKPNWTIAGKNVSYPKDTCKLQHEVELVIAIGEHSKIYGYGVGVDLTRRDLQKDAKKNGKPWFRGKSFIGSSVISDITIFKKNIDFSELRLELCVNNKLRQKGNCKDMIWNPSEILCEISKDFDLEAGDLVFTGTPKGVGDLNKGDLIEASIPGYISHSFKIIK